MKSVTDKKSFIKQQQNQKNIPPVSPQPEPAPPCPQGCSSPTRQPSSVFLKCPVAAEGSRGSLRLLAERGPCRGDDGGAGQAAAQRYERGAGPSWQHTLGQQVSVGQSLSGVDDGAPIVHHGGNPPQGLHCPQSMAEGRGALGQADLLPNVSQGSIALHRGQRGGQDDGLGSSLQDRSNLRVYQAARRAGGTGQGGGGEGDSTSGRAGR